MGAVAFINSETNLRWAFLFFPEFQFLKRRICYQVKHILSLCRLGNYGYKINRIFMPIKIRLLFRDKMYPKQVHSKGLICFYLAITFFIEVNFHWYCSCLLSFYAHLFQAQRILPRSVGLCTTYCNTIKLMLGINGSEY